MLAVAVSALLQTTALAAWLPILSVQDSYQLLVNPGLEGFDAPYAQFQGVNCQVAAGWERFSAGVDEPCLMDARVFAHSHLGSGWVERIEGETSQFIVATLPYTAGIMQQVAGLEPGMGYGFHAALLTIYQSSAQPPVPGVMIKQVGIDPVGGSDPLAPRVVWSQGSGADKEWDLQRRVSVFAQAAALTVFIRIDSPLPAGPWPYLNLSILDSAILAQTPTIRASSPAMSTEPAFVVKWDEVAPAPGGGELKYRDIQWLDEAEGVWHDWTTETYDSQAEFVGQTGHAYRFRARAWQRYPNGAWLHSPYRPDGDTRTVVAGAFLVGHVYSPRGEPVVGATVGISGTSQVATSGPDGAYALCVAPEPGGQTAVVDRQNWTAPPPAYDLHFGLTETITMSWSVLPRDDRVVNGGFEEGLDGWFSVGEGVSATAVTEGAHTGRGSLVLAATTHLGDPAGVGQTVVLTKAWEPVLTYWYRSGASSDADRLLVRLTVVTDTVSVRVSTSTLTVDGWHHGWQPLTGPDGYVTGTTTVEFLLLHPVGWPPAALVIDEVGLGGMPGGPYSCYLPLALQHH